jgi:pimeloyl-ACP methyl ester carboxylesterase
VARLELEPADVAALRLRYGRPDAVRAVHHELAQLGSALEQTRELRASPSIPVTVISGDRLDGKRADPERRRRINELHAALAAASEHGRHVVVPDCGHLVPIDHPEAVAEAVLAMVRGPQRG